ncbi:hypothetical protein ABIB48_002644 [Arthrobacter sp. UYCu511]
MELEQRRTSNRNRQRNEYKKLKHEIDSLCVVVATAKP